MAKKTDSKNKPAAPAKRATKPAPKAKKAAPTKPAVVAEPAVPPVPVAAPVKSSSAKPKATKAATPKAPKAPKAPSFTRDDVALRAYFISEKRRQQGIHGDEHQDWVEAERQLVAEASSAKKAVKA